MRKQTVTVYVALLALVLADVPVALVVGGGPLPALASHQLLAIERSPPFCVCLLLFSGMRAGYAVLKCSAKDACLSFTRAWKSCDW